MFTLVNVTPSGTSTGLGCGPGGCRLVEHRTYPESPEGRDLRALRLSLHLSIGAAGRRCGLTAVEWSGLERGALTLATEDWPRLYALTAVDGKELLDQMLRPTRRPTALSEKEATAVRQAIAGEAQKAEAALASWIDAIPDAEADEVACADCGHRRTEHRADLPAPCLHGWDLAQQAAAMESARAAGACPLRALGEETDHQRAAGGCACIAFAGGT